MFRKRFGKGTVIVTVAVALVTGFVAAQEKKIKQKDLPAAVQKTVTEQSQGAKIRGLNREVDKGKTVYELELLVNGHTKDMIIDATGAILETEEQVTLDSLPAAVQSTLKQQAGKGRIVAVEAVTKGGTLAFYEAQIRQGRRATEIKVSPDGQVTK